MWIKQGQILQTRAQEPTVLILKDRIRIYYSNRDSVGRSYPQYIDIDTEDPHKIIQQVE
jgi:hypothetical protein